MKAYVIHVSDAYDRERHMLKQLEDKALDVSFILDGDKKQLTPMQLEKYFKGEMAVASNRSSCALKHILAYEKLVCDGEDLVLILEDDIRFYKHFSVLNDIVAEVKQRGLANFMISVEDSDLRYVPRSERKKGTLLYAQNGGRLAGAYLIDRGGAESLLTSIQKEKIDIPIDWFHNKCVQADIIKMYWSHPPIATQGSFDGSIDSLIDSGKHGFFRPYSVALQKCYKKLLYALR
ncbi:MAG: glycosyltransferase family 25 protein [Mangrovibacterium sp.]